MFRIYLNRNGNLAPNASHLPGSLSQNNKSIIRPVALCILHAICFAKILPPVFVPAHTQKSARLNSINSRPVLGNRDKTGFGLILNCFVTHSSHVFIFNVFHSLGSFKINKKKILLIQGNPFENFSKENHL